MKYLHTMVRVADLDSSLKFFCDILGMMEVDRIESEKGRFTLVYLAASGDFKSAQEEKAPVVELTYNWPDENGNVEQYNGGRNFGHLAYQVTNIYETCQKLKDAGVVINRPPRDGYMAFIRTPDQISIEFLQAGQPLPPQEPWASMQNTGVW